MNIETIISIGSAIIVVLGGIINYFVLQTKQNHAIKQNADQIVILKEKLSKQTGLHIDTEKDIVMIKTKLKLPQE